MGQPEPVPGAAAEGVGVAVSHAFKRSGAAVVGLGGPSIGPTVAPPDHWRGGPSSWGLASGTQSAPDVGFAQEPTKLIASTRPSGETS